MGDAAAARNRDPAQAGGGGDPVRLAPPAGGDADRGPDHRDAGRPLRGARAGRRLRRSRARAADDRPPGQPARAHDDAGDEPRRARAEIARPRGRVRRRQPRAARGRGARRRRADRLGAERARAGRLRPHEADCRHDRARRPAGRRLDGPAGGPPWCRVRPGGARLAGAVHAADRPRQRRPPRPRPDQPRQAALRPPRGGVRGAGARIAAAAGHAGRPGLVALGRQPAEGAARALDRRCGRR